MKRLISIGVLIFALASAKCQTNFYYVSFTDKAGASYVPFSPEAQLFRQRHHITTDSLDIMVSPNYLDSLRRSGARICHTSRWLNGATVEMTDSLAKAAADWRFIRDVERTRTLTPNAEISLISQHKLITEDTLPTYGQAQKQLEVYNLLPLHQAGFRGQHVRMAVMDCGFPGVDTLACFDALRKENRIIGKRDFTAYDADFSASEGEHGSCCLSLIAGQQEDYMGAAPDVEVLLIKTEEIKTEYPKEPDNWVAALELCDSLGVYLVSTSLGYNFFDDSTMNYQYAHTDGKTYRASIAASIAAQKGMLVCISAGNTANKGTQWPYITIPADANDILTVGAVKEDSTYAAFSSTGPTSDQRIKPEVCAVGYQASLINPHTGLVRKGNGTSFACPLIAGLAASLWSALPEENNLQIRQRIIQSANHHQDPDNLTGYGIPDAWKAYIGASTGIEKPATRQITRCILQNGQIIILKDGVKYNLFGEKTP